MLQPPCPLTFARTRTRARTPNPDLNPGPRPNAQRSPEPNQVLWTDEEVKGFVNARAPPAFVHTFGRYKLPIQRIDTFRYVLMAT